MTVAPADTALLRLCETADSQARTLADLMALALPLEAIDAAGYAALEGRMARLQGSHRRTLDRICAMPARSLPGMVAKAAITRTWLDTTEGGGPAPYADQGVLLAWSLVNDILGTRQ
jgi:hypothetical protein